MGAGRGLGRWGGGGGGAGLILCQTQGTYQIGMSTSRPCFTKRDIFFWMSRECGLEGQAYKLAA